MNHEWKRKYVRTSPEKKTKKIYEREKRRMKTEKWERERERKKERERKENERIYIYMLYTILYEKTLCSLYISMRKHETIWEREREPIYRERGNLFIMLLSIWKRKHIVYIWWALSLEKTIMSILFIYNQNEREKTKEREMKERERKKTRNRSKCRKYNCKREKEKRGEKIEKRKQKEKRKTRERKRREKRKRKEYMKTSYEPYRERTQKREKRRTQSERKRTEREEKEICLYENLTENICYECPAIIYCYFCFMFIYIYIKVFVMLYIYMLFIYICDAYICHILFMKTRNELCPYARKESAEWERKKQNEPQKRTCARNPRICL